MNSLSGNLCFLRFFAAISYETRLEHFTLRIPVNSSIESIYNAWSTSAGIEKWFLASAEFTAPGGGRRDPNDNVRAGDIYLWKWLGWPGGSPEPGKIIEANGRDLVAFTFAKDCIVTISVLNEEGENIVELKQTNIPPDENLGIYFGCSSGWIFYMANLKSVLEGGIDLRNKNEKIGSVVNA